MVPPFRALSSLDFTPFLVRVSCDLSGFVDLVSELCGRQSSGNPPGNLGRLKVEFSQATNEEILMKKSKYSDAQIMGILN